MCNNGGNECHLAAVYSISQVVNKWKYNNRGGTNRFDVIKRRVLIHCVSGILIVEHLKMNIFLWFVSIPLINSRHLTELHVDCGDTNNISYHG